MYILGSASIVEQKTTMFFPLLSNFEINLQVEIIF